MLKQRAAESVHSCNCVDSGKIVVVLVDSIVSVNAFL